MNKFETFLKHPQIFERGAAVSGAIGREFESRRVHQSFTLESASTDIRLIKPAET